MQAAIQVVWVAYSEGNLLLTAPHS
eukprot:COSAG04_NODE_27741_length_280_cov_0.839779_1_plen_24_part_10